MKQREQAMTVTALCTVGHLKKNERKLACLRPCHILSPQVQKAEASKIIGPRELCVVSFLGIHHFTQINKIILSLF